MRFINCELSSKAVGSEIVKNECEKVVDSWVKHEKNSMHLSSIWFPLQCRFA